MSEVNSVLKYFIAIAILHSFATGVVYVGNRLDDAKQPQPSQNIYPNATERLYGPWTEWTSCSRTCGQGISRRSRTCNKRLSDSRHRDESLCLGESIEHKVCMIQECFPGTPSMISSQCSRYNDRLIAGQRAKQWIPKSQGSNPCELRCEALEERLVHGFGKVEDGTPCHGGLCLDGRCLKIGCDDKLGSNAEYDMCGVCRGRNTSCVHYKDVFFEQTPVQPSTERRSDYRDIVVLPVGTRNLEIEQRIGENVLAMRDRNTAVLFHGDENRHHAEHSIGGTIVTYSREDGNRTEVFRAGGPTTLEVYVLVLLRGRNYGIRYQYWLPLEQQHPNRLYPTSAYKSTVVPAQYPHTTESPLGTVSTQAVPDVNKPTSSQFHYRQTPTSYKPKTPPRKTPPVIYGPKRKGLFFPRSFSTPFPIHPHPVKSVSLLTAPESYVTAGTGFVMGFNPSFRTRKPVYNFYQRFRNNTFRPPVNIYRQKPGQLPQETQRDSSSVDRKKSEFEPTRDKLDKEKDQVFSDANVHGSPKNRNPSSRWEYRFNGKRNDSFANRKSALTTPVSIAVLPLPEPEKQSRSGRGRKKSGQRHPFKSRLARGESCAPCQRVKDQTKHFCTSDFVVRASVLGFEFLHGETRYELQVLQSFKNKFSLLPREYIWSPDNCRCPKLRVGKEYVLMGRSDNSYRRNESRLLVDRHCFVRTYNLKYGKRLLRLRKNQTRKCSKKVS